MVLNVVVLLNVVQRQHIKTEQKRSETCPWGTLHVMVTLADS